jgi:uncharacterized phage-associated protein
MPVPKSNVSFDFDIEKAVAATVYIANRHPSELTQAKLFKMLYFADRDHLVRYCRPITGDKYSAMKDGPVPSNLYNAFKGIETRASDHARLLASFLRLDHNHQFPWIEATAPPDEAQLSKSDIACLERVVKEYGRMTFSQVRAIAHDTAAWTNAWAQRGKKDSATMLFEDFFEDDANAIAGVKEEMVENFALRQALGRI